MLCPANLMNPNRLATLLEMNNISFFPDIVFPDDVGPTYVYEYCDSRRGSFKILEDPLAYRII